MPLPLLDPPLPFHRGAAPANAVRPASRARAALATLRAVVRQKTPPVSTALMAKTPYLPPVSTAFVAKTTPLRCVPQVGPDAVGSGPPTPPPRTPVLVRRCPLRRFKRADATLGCGGCPPGQRPVSSRPDGSGAQAGPRKTVDDRIGARGARPAGATSAFSAFALRCVLPRPCISLRQLRFSCASAGGRRGRAAGRRGQGHRHRDCPAAGRPEPRRQGFAAGKGSAASVRDPTTWTIFQQDGPNHLGL